MIEFGFNVAMLVMCLGLFIYLMIHAYIVMHEAEKKAAKTREGYKTSLVELCSAPEPASAPVLEMTEEEFIEEYEDRMREEYPELFVDAGIDDSIDDDL